MIRAHDAIAAARALIGMPYRELDCIGLIVRVIRTAPGGVPGYRTAGTNTLWKSADGAKKYRDLTWRQEGIAGARAGMLAFKRDGENVHHVALVTEKGTVIHSSSAAGKVVETALGNSWDLLATHRYIETAAQAAENGGKRMDWMGAYEAKVVLKRPDAADNFLSVRSGPSVERTRLARLAHGEPVTVLQEMDDGWAYILYGRGTGYVDASYLMKTEAFNPETCMVIEDEAGNVFRPAGRWRVSLDGLD